MNLKILLIPIWEKLPSFKVTACCVLEFRAIYWAGGGKHPSVLQKFGEFPIYCMTKWAGGYKLSSNMAATLEDLKYFTKFEWP